VGTGGPHCHPPSERGELDQAAFPAWLYLISQ
jgi:hypothetical protein